MNNVLRKLKGPIAESAGLLKDGLPLGCGRSVTLTRSIELEAKDARGCGPNQVVANPASSAALD